ncbi:MAG TPA: dihydrodipicolinate synthase family protein [Verrucomicrobiae bacterium]|jgi:4-hydroxy-tetrahydrodipicolinate synthase|nr:dihydrodipicolinate synthase family protein [Verrucomicrobiae bacterium]
MARFKTFSKVLPAANLPMMPDLSIDEEAYRKHLRWLMTHDIGGLVISGHAGELESLTPKERIQVADMARKEIPDNLPMVVGCTGLSTRELVECAKDAKAAGADGLLVMPIPHFAFGAVDRPELIVPCFEELAEKIDLPMIVFRYGVKTGLMYSVEVLLKIAEKVPQVVAIKDSSFDYEEAWVAFQNFPRKINFLVAHGSLFLIRFATSDGAVSSFSNVAPEFITKLYELGHSGKMEEATRLFNKIRPLSDAIYHKTPLMQHWVVEKEALTARGRFPRSTVRPPFQPLPPEHIDGIRKAVAAAGLAPLA